MELETLYWCTLAQRSGEMLERLLDSTMRGESRNNGACSCRETFSGGYVEAARFSRHSLIRDGELYQFCFYEVTAGWVPRRQLRIFSIFWKYPPEHSVVRALDYFTDHNAGFVSRPEDLKVRHRLRIFPDRLTSPELPKILSRSSER